VLSELASLTPAELDLLKAKSDSSP
jgi:hypothetical protein